MKLKLIRWKSNFLIFLTFFSFASCFEKVNRSTNKEKLKQEILQADIDFSKLSEEKGRNEAFVSFCDEKVVLLSPNQMPLIGKDALEKKFLNRSDKNYKLIWVPAFAEVSESGELGYTYGFYQLETADSTGKKLTEEGTYATIWKKQSDGKWKFVLDTGNEGLGKKK